MDKLVCCNKCGSSISHSALKCPICNSDNLGTEQIQDKIKLSASGLAVTGSLLLMPGTILSVALMIGLGEFLRKNDVKKLTKKHSAIDSFLFGDERILVSNDEFVVLSRMAGNIMDLVKIDRSDFIRAFIDESKAQQKSFFRKQQVGIVMEYFDCNTQKPENYGRIFTGDNAQVLAEFAILKLNEYKKTSEEG